VADVFGAKIYGFLAWFLWRSIYLFKMPGWGRRLKVAVSWTLDLFLPPELVQLPLGGSLGVVREHFEPGQEVFRQGDVGDRVYIVLSGRAEVLREFDGSQEAIATLAHGEYFGEMALLRSTTRNATVRCVEAMDVLSLPKREFSLLSENLPQLRQEFQKTSDERGAGSEARERRSSATSA
jgi:NADH:ubiquinone reductase (H+-translocating)